MSKPLGIIPHTFKHAEAFCLMWYACACGHKERIWNSRDGVTPFITTCPSCGQSSLKHIDFQKDQRMEHFKPMVGARVWASISASKATARARKRMRNIEDSVRLEGYTDDQIKELASAVLHDIYRDGHAPELRIVTEAWLRTRSSQLSSSNVKLIRQPAADSLIIWPDDSYCMKSCLSEYKFKGDDYIEIAQESPLFTLISEDVIPDGYKIAMIEVMKAKYFDAIVEAEGCFNAAFYEGLEDALQNTDDSRLKDLVVRRLMHALYACVKVNPR